ncbi:MAG: substrate-binding domain-containing protein [Oscillospiraceae bacterium]|nr:substrate-binding domain-containing protein [Oscillospiraceae bacterium]
MKTIKTACFCCLCLLAVLAPGCKRETGAVLPEEQPIDTKAIRQNYPLINGSTSAFPLIQEIYKAMHEPEITNGEKVWPALPQTAYQTVMSYMMLIDGELDLAIVTQPPKEIAEYAAKAGVELEYTPVCLEALIFITNAKVSIESITTDELRKIYIGRQIDNWSQLGGADIKIEALTRNQDSGSYGLMERFVLKGDKADDEIENYSMMMSMVAMIEGAVNDNYAGEKSLPLGYTLYYYLQNNKQEYKWDDLKILSIDGVKPTPATISSGQYPYFDYYYAVIKSETPKDSAVRTLISWLKSSEGKKAVLSAGLGNIYE